MQEMVRGARSQLPVRKAAPAWLLQGRLRLTSSHRAKGLLSTLRPVQKTRPWCGPPPLVTGFSQWPLFSLVHLPDLSQLVASSDSHQGLGQPHTSDIGPVSRELIRAPK